MESFVPFGGFFPYAYESNIPVMKSYSLVPRCQLCNDKYEEELAIILKGSAPSYVDQNHAKLPLSLQNVDKVRMNNQLDVSKRDLVMEMLLRLVWSLTRYKFDYTERFGDGDASQIGLELDEGYAAPFNGYEYDIISNRLV
ncbi:uncharacterized protein A4U43_C06F9550 [Asparagus officinalis]|uniref:Uncharacterized protein n=1 Tax=Asparagus officinalis TaxID=4686 RepID=A0A5P1ELN2_ASPOF|nr:uncharacterized protein A4U43_C06F9550 [Asparagus officinalis]